MDNAFSKALNSWVASLTLLTLCGCSYVDEVDSPAKTDSPQQSQTEEGSVFLRIPAFKTQTIANVTTIDLFQFSDGVFVKKLTVDSSKDNTVEFARKPGTRIYTLAGYSVEGTQKLSENDFSAMTIPVQEDSHSAPVFFSSVTDLSYFSEDVYIELLRGVARLDIDNQDTELKIESVSLAGAASSSQIFPTDGRSYGMSTDVYSHIYENGINGIEECAFILFETSSPITVTISGRRNGEMVEVVSETPAIVRNTIYTVCVHENGTLNNKARNTQTAMEDQEEEGVLSASIKVRNWEEGDHETGSIDLGESAINIGRSFIPSGVKINSTDNTVTVPADGVSGMKLAFVTHAPLQLGSLLSDTEGISVAPIASEPTDDGYVSEFRVDVAKQPKGAQRYNATVFFNGSSNFFINIKVEASPYQIPTVHIGGHDWMCFNAVSQNPEDQIYLPKGKTVKEMYNEHFVDCLGNMFQYGRPNPFSPWRAYDPNALAGQKRDEPWETKSMMPLPKGYHVPSIDEWEDLIPNGTVIPSSYMTNSGDSIRVTIATVPGTLDDSPSPVTNAQKYLKRGVLFESITTGARLFLPMGGIKTNTSSEIPTDPNFRFDTKSGYWMKEKQQAMLLQCEQRDSESQGILFKRSKWNADGFVMVRGIKD